MIYQATAGQNWDMEVAVKIIEKEKTHIYVHIPMYLWWKKFKDCTWLLRDVVNDTVLKKSHAYFHTASPLTCDPLQCKARPLAVCIPQLSITSKWAEQFFWSKWSWRAHVFMAHLYLLPWVRTDKYLCILPTDTECKGGDKKQRLEWINGEALSNH